MKKFALGTTALMYVMAAFSAPAQTAPQPDFNAAYADLTQASMDSPAYLSSFLEAQKLHYKAESWDRFFGFASFYRNHLSSKKFVPELYLLETLALIKHCQIRASIRVLQSSYAQAQEALGQATPALAQFEDQIGTIQNYLVLQNNFPGVINTEPTRHSPGVFTQQLLWRISEGRGNTVMQGAVKSPIHVRVYVENLCKKRD